MNLLAITNNEIDNTESEKKIPSGETVIIKDFDTMTSFYLVEYHGELFLAHPDELNF